MSSTEKKVKKSTLALNAYAKFMDQKDELPKREFRKLVVEEMRATMGINNPGTEGMYFSWAEKQLTGRPTKVYSRGDGARARKSDRVDEATNAKLNELSREFAKATARVVVEDTEDAEEVAATPFKPVGFGFGVASL